MGEDIEGDGLDDVAVSAPSDSYEGAVYILFAADIGGTSEIDVSTAGAVVFGDSGSGQRFGSSIDTDGDLDKDGYGDLAVGSYSAETAWFFYAPLSGSMTATKDASWTVQGSSDEYLGSATAFVDDVTADGADDLVIGAPLSVNSAGELYAGGAWLFAGHAE